MNNLHIEEGTKVTFQQLKEIARLASKYQSRLSIQESTCEGDILLHPENSDFVYRIFENGLGEIEYFTY
ncbi:MAG: hypothetical protein OCD76_07435 [Reichenbachiella sp.]